MNRLIHYNYSEDYQQSTEDSGTDKFENNDKLNYNQKTVRYKKKRQTYKSSCPCMKDNQMLYCVMQSIKQVTVTETGSDRNGGLTEPDGRNVYDLYSFDEKSYEGGIRGTSWTDRSKRNTLYFSSILCSGADG